MAGLLSAAMTAERPSSACNTGLLVGINLPVDHLGCLRHTKSRTTSRKLILICIYGSRATALAADVAPHAFSD